MLTLLRWAFFVAVISVLAGGALSYRIHGRTPAETACRWAENDTCERLAMRAGEELRAFERRWLEAHAPALARREIPRAARPQTAAQAHPLAPAGRPLDEHSDSDRRALQRILEQRGSR